MDTAGLEKQIGASFKNKDLLLEALTHRSYLNENSDWKLPHNERLEFLGDAVLELIVTEELFHRFPEYTEGQLTAFRASLVNYQELALVAQEISLEKFLLLSRGEANDLGRGREVILANTFEAVIGALYLDKGYEQIKKFVNAKVLPHLDEILKKGSYRDAKSALQEKIQATLKLTPTYRVLGETGPDHRKMFTIGVYYGEKLIATGEGLSKQDAEVEAARRAIGEK